MSIANISVALRFGLVYTMRRGDNVIVYNDVFGKLAKAGWTTYRLKKTKEISDGTVARLRHGMSVSTDTIGKICELCGCQPGDIITYVPERKGE